MKFSKRFLSMLLALCMVLSMVPTLGLTASAATTYTAKKITSTNDIVAGGKYIFVESGNAIISTISTATSNAAESVSNFATSGLEGTEKYVWTLVKSTTDGQYYLQSTDGTYLTNASGKTNLSLTDGKTSAWKFSYDTSYWMIQNASNFDRFLGRTSSTTTVFKAYSVTPDSNLTSYPHNFTIYKLQQDTSTKVEATLTYSENGSTSHTHSGTVYVGDTVTLEDPSVSTVEDYTFVGWSEDTVSATDTRPTMITELTLTAEAQTVYAVYAKEKTSTGAAYKLVKASDVTSGEYIIGALRSSTATNSFYFATGAVNGDMNVTGTSVEILSSSGSRIVAESALPEGTKVFTLNRNSTDGYTVGFDGNYLGYTDATKSRKLAISADYNSTRWSVAASTNTVNVDGCGIHLVSNGYTISENSTSESAIRAYVNTKYRPIYLFQKTSDTITSYTGYTTSPGTSTETGNIPLTVNIRCGAGEVYVVRNNETVVYTNKPNDPNKTYINTGDEITLVMKPGDGYRLAVAEKGSDRITAWSWNTDYGAYTFTHKVTQTRPTSTDNYYNVSFLPRRLDTGITALQATAFKEGLYVITGVPTAQNTAPSTESGNLNASKNSHDPATTYLLYGDDGLTGNVVGRKSAAIKLGDINVTLDNSNPYKMSGLNEACLYDIQAGTGDYEGYYTIRMCGATSNQYLICTKDDSNALETTATLTDGAYWSISIDGNGVAKIQNKNVTNRYLKFMDLGNFQFRSYEESTNGSTWPILYQAAQTGYIVSYSKVGNGTVTAVNSTTGGGVVSGSVQNAGNDITFTFTPAAGYEVASVTINGENIQVSGNTYTYKSLDKPIELIVTFKEIPISNVVTVEYYLNGALSRESETKTLDKNYYIIDLTPTVTINDTEYHYSDLTFSKAVVRINGGEEVEYTSVNDSIAIGKNTTVKLYFLTTAVNLNKTAKETTTPDSSLTGLPNGGTTNNDIGAFSGSNNQDANGNVKQTFEVELKVQSSDMIPGYVTAKATDIILVLDDSNSMFPSSTDGRTINNAEITKTAISEFLDVALGENSDNRIAVVQYNSYAGAWNGSGFVKYNGTMSGYSTLTEANCFMSDRTKVDTAIETALTQDSNNGATNTMGGFKMAQIVAETRNKSTERNLLILLFTDGEPTVRYKDNSSTVTSDLFTDLGYGDTDYSAARTSYIEYDRALASGQNLRKSADSFSNAQNYIYSVALLGGEDYSEADYILVENLMGTAPKGFTFGNDKIENLLDYVYDTSRWFDAASFSNAYFAVKGKDATSVTNDMVDIFKQIAYTTVEDSYLSGTVVDTIPADFKLTDSSINDLEENGWTITDNDDGTTTISKTNVLANETGSSVTYKIEYQGSGYGATFTNTAATYAYTDILTGQPVTASFVKPVVQVIPWTVNDSVVTGIGVDTVIDIRANDPFKELTAAGYTIVDYQVELTDKNGESTKYHDSTEQVGCKFDASWDENSQTVSFYTLAAGEYHFYYVVKATVLSPDGKTETTVTSRATSVSVEVKTLQTTNDASVAVSGSENTINVLWNDALTIDDVAMTNITGTVLYITDSDGNKIQDVTGFDAITPNTDGSISYTTQKNYGLGKICEFYYVVEQTGELNGEQITLSSKATKVTIFSVEDQYIVVDFGLPTKYERYVTDTDTYIADGVKLQNKLTVGALTGDGKYGTLTSDVSNREFSFAPTTMNFDGTCDYTYTVTMTKSAYTKEEVSGTGKVTVIPANNIYFEENFITWVDGYGWGDEATFNDKALQEIENSHLHGYDPAYVPVNDSTADNFSNGNEKSVTVSNEKREAVAHFTFTGTGFDIYSQNSQNSGIIVAEVYKCASYDQIDSKNNCVKVILMDTYLEKFTYYQIPVIMCRGLEHGTYTVKLRAFYNEIFDHNYKGVVTESKVRAVLGLDDETELVFMNHRSADFEAAPSAETRTPAKPAENGQYNVYIDAVRIYNPLKADNVADNSVEAVAYKEAGELLNPSFENINDNLMDCATWTADSQLVDGVLYIAARDEDANHDSLFDENTQICLGGGSKIDYFEMDGKKYLGKDTNGNGKLDNDEAVLYRVTYEDGTTADYKVYMDEAVEEIKDDEGNVVSKRGRSFKYDDTKTGETVVLNREQLSTLNIVCYENKYEAIGSEFEIYLKKDSGIAFNVTSASTVQISAKVPYGDPVTLSVYIGENSWYNIEISSRTEMYYDLSDYVTDGVLILKCSAGDGVLSLCNIKGEKKDKSISLMTVDESTLGAALKAFYPNEVNHEHSYQDVVTEPTCTGAGFTTHTCGCGYTFKDTEVDARGHAWDQGTETLAPTATEDGVMTYTCERCGETKTEPIAATGEPELPPDPIGGDDEPDENPDENPEEKPCDGGEGCPSAQFTDVSPKEWYHLSVDYVVTHNLMEGVGGGKFDPEGTMNRAMLVTVLWRYEGKPAGEKNTFSDVPANEWYTEAVAWAAKNGIVNGIGDGKFDPLGKITREQMATILYRYTENRGFGETTKRGDLRDFPDAKMISEYATDAVAWAVGEGLILGSEGKLLPQGDATRAQVATILMRYIETIVK